MIRVSGLTKTYRVPERAPGLRAALGSLVRRRYREVRAVDDVSFRVEPGERVGFLGPNGAGKTTTLKMLGGLIVPTAGELEVLGHVPQRRAPELLRRITLVMGQKQQLLWDLPARDTFELNRALYDVPHAEWRRTYDELVALLSLESLLERPVRNLSLGERMKCELAAALLHRPSVLFLDEPTIGLDVVMQVQVRRFIQAWNERNGSTVLLTSHYMDDVAALCPRIIVIDGGRIRFDGALADLVRRHRPLRRVRVKPAVMPENPLPFAGLQPTGVEWTGDVAPEAVGDVVREALARLPGAELTLEEPPLEEVFAELFTAGARPPAP